MNRIVKRLLFAPVITVLFFITTNGQDTSQQKKDAAYTDVITKRADKIVATLGITDSAKYKKVRSIITRQYRDLNTIYEDRDAAEKAMKAKAGNDKAAADSGVKMVELEVKTKLEKLHPGYLAALGKYISTEQVNMVKDGMTYGVLPITYKGYKDMIPTLTEPQKAQILTWLTEAREHAMDAESAEKKHAWFGKYKGRINNYLSQQGYDSKKERAEWEKRLKAAGGKL